jgi:hypothetical protein
MAAKLKVEIHGNSVFPTQYIINNSEIVVIARHGLGRFVSVYWYAVFGHAFTHTLNSSCNLCVVCMLYVVCPHQIWRESVQK